MPLQLIRENIVPLYQLQGNTILFPSWPQNEQIGGWVQCILGTKSKHRKQSLTKIIVTYKKENDFWPENEKAELFGVCGCYRRISCIPLYQLQENIKAPQLLQGNMILPCGHYRGIFEGKSQIQSLRLAKIEFSLFSSRPNELGRKYVEWYDSLEI